MRKDDSQTRLPQPFAFAVCKEDINDNLSSVEEVSELGLPNGKIVGVVERVSVLIGHRCVFR